MTRIHLMILWHMHQPQYRDPSSGRYVLPWTRLHATKDYWGMVRVLGEFPRVHATFNMVPSLGMQLEEYASGKFDEPWFDAAFAPAETLSEEQKQEILLRAFQLNRERLMSRWPRYLELADRVQSQGTERSAAVLGLRDWRDLQFLSQLAWMDEEYLASDPDIARLSAKGSDYTERDKAVLRAKQLELLGRVLPEYRLAAERGQIEISATPFYHPILPLLCDTDIARVSNPATPLPIPAFRYPQDAREQLLRARQYHERVFGRAPKGLWPSEGSVSNEALGIAADLGFTWAATDEGVLGRTLDIGFGRDGEGVPDNARQLYAPWRMSVDGREIVCFFRDHYLSDLVGFVYTRMDSAEAAGDLHRRLRAIGERIQSPHPLTVSLILDGENAWEYYPANGRAFLRDFYRRIENDTDIRALTATEALTAAKAAAGIETHRGIFPASWISANFDVWIGHREDVAGWQLLREARAFYAERAAAHATGAGRAPTEAQLAAAYESLLTAEGSDWFWWYGPEHSSANDAEFDAMFRKLLTTVYCELGAAAPDELAEPIKRLAAPAVATPPAEYLKVRVDGRESSYFEWLGSGVYSADRRGGSMHGRMPVLHELRYGFDEQMVYVRVDAFPEAADEMRDAELRVTVEGDQELRIIAFIEKGKLMGYRAETRDLCLLGPDPLVKVAYDRILEVGVARSLVLRGKADTIRIGASLWRAGLPIDVLPPDGSLEVRLGRENFGWD
ncbi:MAG: glycoside hydrolase family 57 protein [Candidatus Acidiferrales bacterium]